MLRGSAIVMKTAAGSLVPGVPGSYVLLAYLPAAACISSVGGSKKWRLEAGFFAYVGSARGPGGLRARLDRHFRAQRKPHWHLDALLERASPCGYLCLCGEANECALAAAIAEVAELAVAGFGCSDCHCRSHLFRLAGPSGSLKTCLFQLVLASAVLALSAGAAQAGQRGKPGGQS